MPRQILIEGYTPTEILSLSREELSGFVFCDEPLVFCVGSAQILGQFHIDRDALVLELAQIEGGGEGALPVLSALASRFAQREGLTVIEWWVHAVRCANPNLNFGRCLRNGDLKLRMLPVWASAISYEAG